MDHQQDGCPRAPGQEGPVTGAGLQEPSRRGACRSGCRRFPSAYPPSPSAPGLSWTSHAQPLPLNQRAPSSHVLPIGFLSLSPTIALSRHHHTPRLPLPSLLPACPHDPLKNSAYDITATHYFPDTSPQATSLQLSSQPPLSLLPAPLPPFQSSGSSSSLCHRPFAHAIPSAWNAPPCAVPI